MHLPARPLHNLGLEFPRVTEGSPSSPAHPKGSEGGGDPRYTLPGILDEIVAEERTTPCDVSDVSDARVTTHQVGSVPGESR